MHFCSCCCSIYQCLNIIYTGINEEERSACPKIRCIQQIGISPSRNGLQWSGRLIQLGEAHG